MKLKDSLYRIESQHDGIFELLMLDGHPVYEGHFPGEPITPGVLTLAIVRECASLLADKELQYSAVKNCRFAAMIRPTERLTLTINHTITDGDHQVAAEITDKEGNLRLQLEATLTDCPR